MPPFPKALAHVWRPYLRLRRRIKPGFAGHDPIGWQDIDAFLRRSGVSLTPWDIELIEAIDDIYIGAVRAKASPPKEKGVIASVSARDGLGVRALLGSFGRRGRRKKA